MSTSKYWSLDIDTEGQIYDNVAWDLPGFRGVRSSRGKTTITSGRGGGGSSKKQPCLGHRQ